MKETIAHNEINELLNRLGDLAATWRGLIGEDDKREVVQLDYAHTVEQLYALGWDDFLDIEDRLPYPHLPESYRTKHPQRLRKLDWSNPKNKKDSS